MTCDRVIVSPGMAAIVCAPTRRCPCGARATLLCDWKVTTNRIGTCDKPLCGRCSTSPTPGKDLCASHAQAFELWLTAR